MTIAREYQHSFELFGTDVRLLIGFGARPSEAGFIAAQVRERLRSIHRTLSRFDPDSELSYLNAHAGESVRVSQTLLGAIVASLRAAERSGGLVDPTVLTDLVRAGYGISRAGVTPASLLEAIATAPRPRPALPRAQADWRRICVSERSRVVRLPHGVSIDLGGTAKGWAVDIAGDILGGTPSFAVDAGGDLRVGGATRAPRVIEIEHPLDAANNRCIQLTAGAVATSGLRTRLWRTPKDLPTT